MTSCETLARPAPASTSCMVAASGSYPSGQAHTTSTSSLAARRSQECVMLLPSPTYTTCGAATTVGVLRGRVHQRLGAPRAGRALVPSTRPITSCIVSASAMIWQGWL